MRGPASIQRTLGILLGLATLACCLTDALAAPPAKAKKDKPSKDSGLALPGIPEPDLPDVSFSGSDDADQGPTVVDKDETPEGRNELREINTRAKEIVGRVDVIEKERRPYAVRRDILLGEMRKLESDVVNATMEIDAGLRQLELLQGQYNIAPNQPMRDALRNQMMLVQNNIANLKSGIDVCKQQFQQRVPTFQALNNTIAPMDKNLQQEWQQLSQARKNWLDLRQPVEKYTRGEYEELHDVLKDWLVIDGLWPAAYCWMALCKYELDELDAAEDYLQKAVQIQSQVLGLSKNLPQVEALTGAIYLGQKGKSSKASKAMDRAIQLSKKNPDWETSFIMGRGYASQKGQDLKAHANLKKALELNRNCLCAKLWMARIQTISDKENVRDLKEGTKTLEKIWKSTGERSWRVAMFLMEAKLVAGDTAEAHELWQKALELAPSEEERGKIQAEYKLIVERVKNSKEPKAKGKIKAVKSDGDQPASRLARRKLAAQP